MSFLKNKRLAILGGTGTLGRALIKEIACSHSNVKEVLIYSRDEIKQLEMMDDFLSDFYPFLSYKLGDVRDLERLNEVLNDVDYVIHAAAVKHVVMAEKNPEECWKTNVIGTKNVIEACKEVDVHKAILISTDKAFNPFGVYGKSKREAERIWLDDEESKMFSVVRLGNIIGARGSVFEAFEKQRKSGVIKVTHPEATRFCISQEEAADFVLDSLQSDRSMSVPEMKSFRVIDLAKQIAPECKIEITGLRPGDKLHEELGSFSSFDLIDQLKEV